LELLKRKSKSRTDPIDWNPKSINMTQEVVGEMEEYLTQYYEKHKKSEQAWQKARRVLPLGVGSNVRGFSPFPFFIKESRGAKVWDIDGNEYIDCQLAYGPLMVGHAHPKLIAAIQDQMSKGSVYAMPYEKQYEAIQELQKRFPVMEMLRFGNSGTEVTMHAIRAARGYTGKDKIIKLEGGYHGPHDYALWSIHPQAGQTGPERHPSVVKMSEGVPACVGDTVIVVPYNNIEALEYAVRKYEGEIAAFILEPVMGNSTCILPRDGYLKKVRQITQKENIVLIFDEVITGCRVAYGGATEYFKVNPDMITLSKAIGGGYSVAAFGGKREIMQLIENQVAHYGTYNANPIGITAVVTTLRDILTPEATKKLIAKSDEVFAEMDGILKKSGVAAQLAHIGAMGSIAFTDEDVKDYRTMLSMSKELWHKFFINMLNKGVIMIGGDPTETIFFSVQHTDEDYEKILTCFKETVNTLQA
jgi:glutamate-1-semialdehyde 2,1-aminomutase